MAADLSAAERRAAAMLQRGITPTSLPDPISNVLLHDAATGRLEAHYPMPGAAEPVQVVDLAFLYRLTNIHPALAEAAARHGMAVSRPATRCRVAQSLRAGFTAFLVETSRTDLHLADITTALLRQFKHWLDERRTRTGEPLSEATRYLLLMDLQLLLRRIQQRGTWRGRLDPELTLIPNPYPGMYRKHKPTTPLTDEELEKVYLAASRKVAEHMHATNATLTEMAVAPDQAKWDADTRPTFGQAVKAVWEIYGAEIPDWMTFQAEHPTLARTLIGRWSEARAVLVPSYTALVPYIILFGLYFRYNGSVLFGAKRSNFVERRFLGKPRVVANAYKHRSRKRQHAAVPATDDPDNPATLLSFMDRWTERARSRTPSHSRGHLFIAATTAKRGWVRNLEHAALHGPFASFSKANDLPDISMRILRATGIDVVHDLFRGDFIAMAAASGGTNPDTLLTHYANGGVRQRQEEALASAMVLKERWEASNGTIDPRLNRGDDRAAATPGFICLDPFSSPMPGQADKPICAAYGMCPACPLAVVLRNSGYSYAQLLLLRDAIERTIDDVAGTAKWGPVLDRLNTYWLRTFPPAARRSASEKFSDLPALPMVE